MFVIRNLKQNEPKGFEKKIDNENSTLYEFKADRMPIGTFLADEPFQTTENKLQKNDVLIPLLMVFKTSLEESEAKNT